MKFIFGDFKGVKEKGKFSHSMFPLSIKPETLDENDKLKDIAEKVRQHLGMESGEIEIQIGFEYVMKEE